MCSHHLAQSADTFRSELDHGISLVGIDYGTHPPVQQTSTALILLLNRQE